MLLRLLLDTFFQLVCRLRPDKITYQSDILFSGSVSILRWNKFKSDVGSC